MRNKNLYYSVYTKPYCECNVSLFNVLAKDLYFCSEICSKISPLKVNVFLTVDFIKDMINLKTQQKISDEN